MTKFALSGLLRARGVQEEQARRSLGGAQSRLSTAETTVLRRTSELQGAGSAPSGPAAHFLAAVAARAAMAAAVGEAVLARSVSEQDLDAAREQWMQARMRARAIERLAERHREAQLAERARADQALSDDLSGARHAARSSRGLA
ncbi:flagellar export protein FliJ [Angustibacter sp. McL0619]|uniref:flagellar export protein FliJ n=1 Tax=Angustibacter sp. McL0619 TaxID=3415676 RepID=UPI003CFA58C0